MPDSAHSTTGDGAPETIQPAGRAAPADRGPSPAEQAPPAPISGNGATSTEAPAASAPNGGGVLLVEQKAKEPAAAEHPDADLRPALVRAGSQIWALRSALLWMVVAVAALAAAALATPPGWWRAL